MIMKMRNKLILGAAAALALVSLTACGGQDSAEIATFQGGQVTVHDFFEQARMSQTNQSLVQQMIIYRVFEAKYGDKVTNEQIQTQFDQIKEAQGDNFAQALQNAGMTEESLRDQIKQNLAFEAGIKAHVKVTDEDLQNAWASFHPEVTASIIQVASEDDAKAVLEEVKKPDADFAAIAKEKSIDTATREDGGKVSFDSTSTNVPQEVRTAAFALKNGEISDIITVTNTQTFQQSFFIVKMNETSEKGNDMDKFKDQIHDIAETNQAADQAFQTRVIGEVLKAANVKIVDPTFNNVLATFMPTQTTDTSETSESTSESN